jgi:hypothetical protein
MDMITTLVDKHATLFRGRIPLDSELPEGWFALVDALCSELETDMSSQELSAFHFRQITHERGMLRMRRAGIRQLRVEVLIESVEKLSSWICMDCGCAGHIRIGKPCLTLCNFCAEERRMRAARIGRRSSAG